MATPDLPGEPRRLLTRAEYEQLVLAGVEVAKSSLARDRGPKAALYAEAGIPEYWIVNLADGLVEVRTEIVGGTCARVRPFRAFPDVEIAVDDFLR